MDLNKIAHIAQIACVPPGFYCAYAEWVQLHPAQNVSASQVGDIAVSTTTQMSPLFWASLGAFGALLILGVVLAIIARLDRKRGRTQLVIHSALYGFGSDTKHYVDVAEKLRSYSPNALAIPVENRFLVVQDPAYKKDKHIEVEYTFQGEKRTVDRPEYALLTLPHDVWADGEIRRLAKIVENNKDAPLLIERYRDDYEKAAGECERLKAEVSLNGDAVSNARELRSALDRCVEEYSRLKEQLESIYPLVVPVKYGMQDKPEKQARYNGLLLSNDGNRVAYEIEVTPFRVGAWVISFESILRFEPRAAAPIFVDVRDGNVSDGDLIRHIMDVQKVNATLGDPVPFTITYRDENQNRFRTLCEFQITVSGFVAKYVKREKIA